MVGIIHSFFTPAYLVTSLVCRQMWMRSLYRTKEEQHLHLDNTLAPLFELVQQSNSQRKPYTPCYETSPGPQYPTAAA